MKTAGRAFTMGMFGALGVAAAILVPTGIAVLVGERKLRRILSDFENDMKRRTEDLFGTPDSPCVDAAGNPCEKGSDACAVIAHGNPHR